MTQAANYAARKTVQDGVEIVVLTDAARRVEVSIAPGVGNIAYEMKVNGKNVFWTPFRTVADMKARPAHCGNPFLWPWANRIDQQSYWVNGKHYILNPELKNYRLDGKQQPIHGMLTFSADWQVTHVSADGRSAWATSRFEFWKYPDLMAQFPFAHTVEMTYRLSAGVLEVETRVENHAKAPIPVSLGYHPYFRLHDSPRNDWKVHLAAREHLMLSETLVPTGEVKPVALPDPVSLAGNQLDDVFSGLVRGEDGRAHFWVQGKAEKIEVIYGPKYPVAVVYAPLGREFICFEPMSAPTNAFNLAHKGIYRDLQSIPPASSWKESFWISPSGF
jgi:aldose 1-epimerase